MTRLSHKRTLLTALLSGTLAFSPVLSTAQYAFADTPIRAMANASTETNLRNELENGTDNTVTVMKSMDISSPITIKRTVTLDLGDPSNVLNFADGAGFIIEGGNLTIKGSGTLKIPSGALVHGSTGTVIIQSGVFNSGSEPLSKGGLTYTVTGGKFSTVKDVDVFNTNFVADDYAAYGNNGTYEVSKGPRVKQFDNVSMDEKFEYTGSFIEPVPSVIQDGKPLVINKDFKVTYSNNLNVGTATATIKSVDESRMDVKSFEITPKEVKLSAPNYTSYTAGLELGEKVEVTATGLVSGHKFSSTPYAKAEPSTSTLYGEVYKLVVDTSTLKIVDEDGNDVTKNYKFITSDGSITIYDLSDLYYDYDYGYVDYTDLYLSNATVTLTADPAPYKSSGYRDRDNIKSVVVNGIDVTSRCEYSYSGDADPGSTVTVTITPSNSFYNNTSTYRSAATPSNSSNTSPKSQSISAASEEVVSLSAMTENEEQIAIVANELPEIVAQAYCSGLYPSGSEYYDMLYWLMNNSAANSSYYTDLSRYLYGNYGILNLGNYIGTNGNTSLLNLINRYYRGGYYGNWYNGYYHNGYYNNGNFFDHNNRTYRLTGSKTVTFKISDSNSTVTVSANNVTKRQGDPDPVLTATILGVNESDKSKINYTISRVQGETPGTYAINVTGATEQNGYKVTFVPGTLTITAATAGTDVAGGAITAGTGTTATTPAVLPTSPATVAATTSANKLAATGDNTFLGYGVLALVGVAVVALGVFFNHRKKDGE